MKLNLDTKMFDAAATAALKAAGIVIPEADQDMTAKTLVCRALVNGLPNENPSAEEKLKNYELLLKLTTGPAEVDVPAEDISRLKALVGKLYPTLFVGRLHEILDPKPKAAVA
jgi:hypothetical protein